MLCGEGIHREGTCTDLRSIKTERVKLPIRIVLAWELRPQVLNSKAVNRPVPSTGTVIVGDDEFSSGSGVRNVDVRGVLRGVAAGPLRTTPVCVLGAGLCCHGLARAGRGTRLV